MPTVCTLLHSNKLSEKFYKKDKYIYQYAGDGIDVAVAEAALNIIIDMSFCTDSFRELTATYCRNKFLDKISKEVASYLNKEEPFNIDGYIRFRGREYIKQTNSFLLCVFRKIIVLDKYNAIISEFKKHLKEGRWGKETIYLENIDGFIEIFDQNYNHITDKAIYLFIIEYGNECSIKPNDAILHYLIKTVPKMIFIKSKSENVFIETLKQIFEGRIYCIS